MTQDTLAMEPSNQTYLIIGAGIFGASTALHLKRCFPSAKVQLIDRTPFPNPSAASHDSHKIVRGDYDTRFYMILALEALRHWNNDPVYKPYFHETGMCYIDNEGIGLKTYENYQKVKPEADVVMMTPEQAKTRWPIHNDTNWDDVGEFLWSPYSGWADAARVLESAIQAAVDIGVEYNKASISSLTFDRSGACTGADCADGRTFAAHSALLCTGAYTAKILADSAPNRADLQVGDRLDCAGAITCIINIPADQRSRFRSDPVFINEMSHTAGDMLPINSAGQIKFNCQTSFTNKVHHEKSNQTLSMPPQSVGARVWSQDVPVGLKKDILKVAKNSYGRAIEGFEIEAYRMCWEGTTPNQDWIISPHSTCKNLYIATGGSFHTFKFLPILGPYVVQMLLGQLSPELAKRWAWDRESDGIACNAYIPTRDLKDVEGYEDWIQGKNLGGAEWKTVTFP